MKKAKSLLTILSLILAMTSCTKKEENAKSVVIPSPASTVSVKPSDGPAEPKVTGLLMQGERLLKMKEDGAADEVTMEITLTDGTKVSKDGKIIFADGRKATLPSGSAIQMDGKMQGTDSLIPDDMTVKGFQMKDGKMMMVMKDGKTTPMDTYIRLKNGATVETDGTIMKKDGTHDTLKEGNVVLLGGSIVK